MTQHFFRPLAQRALIGAGLLFLVCGAAPAADDLPFTGLEGHWAGNGTIDFSNGTRESIKCRANYDLPKQDNLQLEVHCASDSYQFDLRGSANYAGGAVTGSWSESTRNAAGTISGTAGKDRLQVVATSSAFTATLTLVTRGDSQTIDIKSQESKASIKGASISLKRN